MSAPRFIRLSCVLLFVAVAGSWSCSSGDDNPYTPSPRPKELDSGNIPGAGGTYEHRFFNSGSFPYHCAIHAGMPGTVTVSAGAPDTVASVAITPTGPFRAAWGRRGGGVT